MNVSDVEVSPASCHCEIVRVGVGVCTSVRVHVGGPAKVDAADVAIGTNAKPHKLAKANAFEKAVVRMARRFFGCPHRLPLQMVNRGDRIASRSGR